MRTLRFWSVFLVYLLCIPSSFLSIPNKRNGLKYGASKGKLACKTNWKENSKKETTPAEPHPQTVEAATAPLPARAPSLAEVITELEGVLPHASPSIRHFARELGVDVAKVSGSGPKGRILQEDIQAYVKSALSALSNSAQTAATGGALNLPPWPKIDFTKFGPIESKPLGRIKKLSGSYLARN